MKNESRVGLIPRYIKVPCSDKDWYKTLVTAENTVASKYPSSCPAIAFDQYHDTRY